MLIAQMVARNESSRFLEPVMKRVREVADFVIFTDDASTDDTPHVASRYADSVIQLDEPTFAKDEGALRQTAWYHLSRYANPGDWVLAIDADEMLYGTENLKTLMQGPHDVLGITFFHMWNDHQYRVDKLWSPVTSSRLFRYYEGGEFNKRKLACGSEPTYVQELIRRGRFNTNTGLRMKHLGYERDEDKIAKHERYMELDGGSYHNRAHLESILDPNPTLEEWVD